MTRAVFREIGEEVGDLPAGWVFVFGSNEAGVHGGGAAALAHERFGARWRHGRGRTGRSYAIPTKNREIRTLPLSDVAREVAIFLAHAVFHPETNFYVTAIGTGLAGYRHADIAPMFTDAPSNCSLPGEWESILCPSTD